MALNWTFLSSITGDIVALRSSDSILYYPTIAVTDRNKRGRRRGGKDDEERQIKFAIIYEFINTLSGLWAL
jgi:hypothetical protein